MQRILAFLLLIVTGFSPAAAVLPDLSVHAPQLPLCCRATGKHKCGMRSTEAPAQPALYSLCSQCPAAPASNLAVAAISFFPPKDSDRLYAAFFNHLATQSELEARHSVCPERSHLKRGPPALLS